MSFVSAKPVINKHKIMYKFTNPVYNKKYKIERKSRIIGHKLHFTVNPESWFIVTM